MPVLTISITESPIQKIAGIPISVILETNIPATIFFTLDSTEPTLSSDVVVGPINLPTNVNSVLLKAFATNGVSTTPVFSKRFAPDVTTNVRRPRAKVSPFHPNNNKCSIGSGNLPDYVNYSESTGVIVDGANTDGIPDGYDGTATGTPASETDLPYNRSNYEIVYSTRNSQGESGPNIGNLPATVTLVEPVPINQSNQANSKLFNPKSPVIIQDGRNPPDHPSLALTNRQFFSLGDFETIRDGAVYRNTGYDGSTPTGSFVRAIFNAQENTYTFYYRDAETNRWIISIEPYEATGNNEAMRQFQLSSSVKSAAGIVYQWIPFKRSVHR